MKWPDPKPGDYLSAEMLNVLYDAIRNGPSVVPPLYITGGSIAWGDGAGIWIQFTGAPTDDKHPWKQVLAGPDGTWVDGSMTGSVADDPAFEINGSTADLSGRRAKAWRDKTSYEMRFHYSICS